MTLAEPDTESNARRAALTVHALPPAEREWLLAQLGDGHRTRLQALLAELASLGIPQDPQVVRQALAAVPGHVSGSLPIDAKALCEALAGEPSSRMRGHWLAALTPAECEAVLAHWAAHLEATPKVAALVRWTPALHAAVLDAWREVSLTKEPA